MLNLNFEFKMVLNLYIRIRPSLEFAGHASYGTTQEWSDVISRKERRHRRSCSSCPGCTEQYLAPKY